MQPGAPEDSTWNTISISIELLSVCAAPSSGVSFCFCFVSLAKAAAVTFGGGAGVLQCTTCHHGNGALSMMCLAGRSGSTQVHRMSRSSARR